MEFIKLARIPGWSFTIIFYVYVLLLFGSCPVVLNQSCLDKQSGEMNVGEPAIKASTCGDSNGLTSADNDDSENERVETGLDFIPSNYELELDKEFFFDSAPEIVERRRNTNVIEFVRMFIRNIKGFPVERQKFDSPIGSGTDIKKKPAWCFYPYLLKDLVKVELNIYNILSKYYSEHIKEFIFDALESYLRDIEESSLRAIRNVEASNVGSTSPEDPYLYIATHPLLIYRLIRRFAEDLQPILSELEPENDELLAALYEEGNPNLLVFPTSEDLDDALESISRTQFGHELNTYDLGRGILVDVDTGIHLNALYSLEVGTYYLKAKDYDYSIQWLHFALETAKKSALTKNYPEVGVFFRGMLESAVHQHNTNFKHRFFDYWFPSVFNTTVTLPFEPSSYTRRFDELKPLGSKARNNSVWNWALKANFKRVCSGEILQTDAEIAELKCWYEHSSNNYWLINPLKTELLNMDPPVFQIYDFIGEGLIERIKDAAVSQLERSTVVDVDNPVKSKVDSTRTSSQTWLYEDREDRFLEPLAKKMELMSGLVIVKPMASDAFQVAAYGPSHHYEAHIDSFEDPRRTIEKGNRITTIMGYLTDVKVGGRTGFPVAGTFAEPIKGSVVMWDNTQRNGEKRDERTWHGGCPVVLGVKWITNKWVYYKENLFTYQCSLNPNE